jgi:succinyl-CoA synthetase beta subunit
MDLLEYQGKELLRAAGVPTPRGRRADSVSEALMVTGEIDLPVAVKAQVRSGKRGKAGGIRVCRQLAEVEEAAGELLAMSIGGHGVECLLVEEAVDIERELYLAFILSRHHRAPLLLMVPRGGVDVEELARLGERVLQIPIDPLLGLCDYTVRQVVAAAGLPPEPRDTVMAGGGREPAAERWGTGPSLAARTAHLAAVLRGLWRAYEENDATLVEVNPLVLTRAGSVTCLDAKVTLDDNAAYRQPMVRDALAAGDPREVEARRAGLTFVGLDGDIGVIANGAGLAMSTLDLIAAAGGQAACFCDIGGGASAEVVAKALDLVLAGRNISSLVLNVFGGITRGDEVAQGLIVAFRQTSIDMPVFMRLAGNGAAEGREMLAAAALPSLVVLESAGEAVAAAVAATEAGAPRAGAADTRQPLSGSQASGGR